LAVAQRQRPGLAGAELRQALLAGLAGEAARLGELPWVELDADGPRAGGAGHRPGELAQAAADVEQALAGPRGQLAEAALVDQVGRRRQAALLLGPRPGDVARALAVVRHGPSRCRAGASGPPPPGGGGSGWGGRLRGARTPLPRPPPPGGGR